jgi:hypothetical protein
MFIHSAVPVIAAESLYAAACPHPSPRALRPGSLFGAMSYALDMTEGQPPGPP